MPGMGLIQPWHLLIITLVGAALLLLLLAVAAWLVRRPGARATRRSAPPLPREEI